MKWNILQANKKPQSDSASFLKTSRQGLVEKCKKVMMSCTTVPQMISALRYVELAGMTHLELYKQYSEFKNHVTEGL